MQGSVNNKTRTSKKYVEYTVPGVVVFIGVVMVAAAMVVVGMEEVVVITGSKTILRFVRVLISSKLSFMILKIVFKLSCIAAYQGFFRRKCKIFQPEV